MTNFILIMDYSHRIKLLQNYLEQSGLDAFLVLTRLNRQYVSGFTGSAGAVLITSPNPSSRGGEKGEVASLFVDSRYTIRAKRESPLPVRQLSSLPLTSLTGLRGRVREG